MGMYDYINGEQVKCFPVIYLYKNMPTYSGGSLNGYNTGDVVPYRTPYYNYTPNFTVLDFSHNREFLGYDFILHKIRDGKVVLTKEDCVDDTDFEGATMVIDYMGNPVNIRLSADVYQYMADYEKMDKEIELVNTRWNHLFVESLKLSQQYVTAAENDSLDAEKIKHEIDAVHYEMQKENEEQPSKIKNITDAFFQKWGRPSVDRDCIRLGEWIDILENEKKQKEKEQSKENLNIISKRINIITKVIEEMTERDSSLQERYKAWQEQH